jgi:hypothetical protein
MIQSCNGIQRALIHYVDLPMNLNPDFSPYQRVQVQVKVPVQVEGGGA